MEPMNDEKLRQLILYISEQCAAKRHYGKTVLYKLLYFSDFAAYRRLGQPITGTPYQKIDHGPAPLDRDRVLSSLERKRALVIQSLWVGGYEQKKPVNLVTPDLGSFSGQEVAIVNEMIDFYGDMTAKQIENASHDEPGWFTTDMYDLIPYESALVSREPISDKEAEHASALAEKYGIVGD